MKTRVLPISLTCFLFIGLAKLSWAGSTPNAIPHTGIALEYTLAYGPQIQESQEENFLRRIDQIKTEPLELLPASDCRLDQLEEEVFKTYYTQGQEIPLQIKVSLQRKRQQIDFMRSHIDSLYYMQALQAINKETPDWDEAMENIEKSL